MSEQKTEIQYDPKSLRNTIKIALGDKWTKELEDQLFWPISYFCNNNCNAVRNEIFAKLHDALGITDKLQLASIGFPVT